MVPVGEPVMDVSGELVCTKSFPSMPSHFWNDPDGAKYKRAYFSKYPGSYVQNAKILDVLVCFPIGIWHHGDYCMISSATGGIFMLGRR